MNFLTIELLSIAILTAVVCALPGVFLVLRGASLMSDAMSHALLLGIVGMFLWVRSLTSPFLLLGAGIAGFLVVVLTEYIMQRTRLSKDAAIGLLFPFFFSGAVILINLYTRDVHLDTDMVLLGDLVFAPFSRCVIAGVDYGPQALWLLGILLLLVVSIFLIFRRSLVVVLFDPLYAYTIQAQPHVVYYWMMGLTSIVAVSVFSVVGSVIVVALMIAPAASAFCTARSFNQMLIHAMSYSLCAAVSGYWLAAWADVSIAGCIATMSGILFAVVVMGAPRIGIIGRVYAYGIIWLEVSVALITERATCRIQQRFSRSMVQKIYGWSFCWTICVLWYACFSKKIASAGKGNYYIIPNFTVKNNNVQ
jgi:manganese/zinc/iron transport system permease protein